MPDPEFLVKSVPSEYRLSGVRRADDDGRTSQLLLLHDVALLGAAFIRP